MIASLVTSGWAQGTAPHFTPSHVGETGTRGTTIHAKLDLSNADINWTNQEYEVAAFVGNECYATTFGEMNIDYGDRDLYYNYFSAEGLQLQRFGP